MKIKTKLSIGVGSLFIVILIVLGLSTYFIHQLAHDAGAVIEDNQITLDYVQSMQQSINKIHVKVIGNSQKNIANNMVSSFEKNLSTQKDNVTERGEKEATENVRKHFAAYKNLYITSSKNTSIDSANYYYSKINEELNYIYKLNRDAIVKKNNKAVDTATTGINLVSLVGTLLLIGAFTFVLNFPGYIANPIRELSEKIRGIADKNFNQRLDFSANDEFGDLAESFNYMAKQLNDFQKSTLADILVEKKRIESIVNNLDEGIILLDANQHVIVANPTIGKLMDLQTEELLGKQVQEISKQNDLFKAITSNIESAKKKHDPLHITVDKEENFYQKHVHAVYTYDDWAKKNNLSGYVIFLKNITEFKKLDIAKTNFLATVSHELKTPLSSINLSLKLLNDKRVGELSSEQTHLLNNIHHESKRLLRYVNE
ncbi:MAG: HAMP domain-containing protein, partial [Sphingobacteriales bacterium]